MERTLSQQLQELVGSRVRIRHRWERENSPFEVYVMVVKIRSSGTVLIKTTWGMWHELWLEGIQASVLVYRDSRNIDARTAQKEVTDEDWA